jgi:hypothetical protein
MSERVTSTAHVTLQSSLGRIEVRELTGRRLAHMRTSHVSSTIL